MITLTRILEATNFPGNFTGTTRKAWELELLKQAREIELGERSKFSFTSSRWKDAKPYLIAESNQKCAYCEVNFTTIAYGDVEHYRPKSVYYWLAYSYHNYTVSCQLCNQKYKGSKFPVLNHKLSAPAVLSSSTDADLSALAGTLTVDPLQDAAGLEYTLFCQAHQAERPLSLDPYLDNPQNYFAYRYLDTTKEVFVEPITDDAKKLVNSCIKLFGLNRKELRDIRYRRLLEYRFHRQIIDDTSLPQLYRTGAANIIARNYIANSAEFAGMFRYFNERAIDPLPDF